MNKTRQKLVSTKENLILKSLRNFYEINNNIEKINPIISGESIISLRLLDHFITNYAKKYRTSYYYNGNIFCVYREYKAQLKSYNKRFFDPFCRRTRIRFYYSEGKFIETTIGQLNFFRWAIQNGILDYIENKSNFIEINEHMNKRDKENKEKKIESYNKDLKYNDKLVTKMVTKGNIYNGEIRVKIGFE